MYPYLLAPHLYKQASLQKHAFWNRLAAWVIHNLAQRYAGLAETALSGAGETALKGARQAFTQAAESLANRVANTGIKWYQPHRAWSMLRQMPKQVHSLFKQHYGGITGASEAFGKGGKLALENIGHGAAYHLGRTVTNPYLLTGGGMLGAYGTYRLLRTPPWYERWFG